METQIHGDLDALPDDFVEAMNGSSDCFRPSEIQLNDKYVFLVETEPVISSAYEKSVPARLYLCRLKTCLEEQKHLKNIRFINEKYTLWITLDELPSTIPVPKAIRRSDAKAKSPKTDKGPGVIVWPDGHSQTLIGFLIQRTTPEDRDRVQQSRFDLASSGAQLPRKHSARVSAAAAQRGTEIIDDFKSVIIDGHEINLSAKHKARAFLRFLYKELHGKARKDFLMDAMREKFNSQFDDAHEGKRWQSDRLREDLFKGVSVSDFDLIFETIDRTSGRYRLKI